MPQSISAFLVDLSTWILILREEILNSRIGAKGTSDCFSVEALISRQRLTPSSRGASCHRSLSVRLPRKVMASKFFDTYVVGVNFSYPLRHRRNASTTLRSNNDEGALREDTNLALPKMWPDPPDVHQNEVNTDLFQQRRAPLEDLRHEGSSLQSSRMSDKLETIAVGNIRPETFGGAHQHNPCQCRSTILR